MRGEQIAFLGGGNMAEAILAGLLAGEVASPERLVGADVATLGMPRARGAAS